MTRLVRLALLASAALGCAGAAPSAAQVPPSAGDVDLTAFAPLPPEPLPVPPPLDCARTLPTLGYRAGRKSAVTLVDADGAAVELATASAYAVMRAAAARAGVVLRVVSGFRTMEEQTWLYRAWRAGFGNLAARPGHSSHQSGRAIDFNTLTPGVAGWLAAHARRFGFRPTVPSEPWHWEYRGRLVRAGCLVPPPPPVAARRRHVRPRG